METKHDLIEEMRRGVMRVQNKATWLANMPVELGNGMVLTPREAHAIRALGCDPALTVTGLSEVFGFTMSAASQLVSKLEKRGLVTKSVSSANSKERVLELTETGREAFAAHDRMFKEHRADLQARMETFSIAQIAAATVIMGVFEDVIDHRIKMLSG